MEQQLVSLRAGLKNVDWNLRAEVAPGDYYKEDVLYCGTCNKPKEKKIVGNVMGTFFRTIPCDCEKTARAQQAAEERILAAERQAEELRREKEKRRVQSFPDRRMTEWTFASDDKSNPELSELAKRYANNFYSIRDEGMGLLLFGGVGTGKTYITACIVNALIDFDFNCLVTSFSRLCNQIYDMKTGRQEYIDSLNEYDLLVIDDLGVERGTEYMGEIVQNVIDSRYRANKPIIVTTNLTGEELKHPRDIRSSRVYSRLYEMCYPFEVKGVDKRKLQLKEKSTRFRKMLGYEDEL